MRRVLYLLVVAIFVGLSATSADAGQAPTYHLSFHTLHSSPGERVSKFTLHFRSAMIIGIRNIPIGWKINIDNDPSWMTQISGTAVVGAAWLEPSVLRPWFLSLLSGPPGRSASKKAIGIEGFVVLSNGDNARTVEIGKGDVSLIPLRIGR